MSRQLSQKQRFFVVLIYIVLITSIFSSFGGKVKDIVNDTTNIGVWFCSGALLIIFGIFITEPFFSRPADTITNSVAVLLALLALPDKKALTGYWLILIFILVLIILSIITIIFKTSDNKAIRTIHFIVLHIGSARVVFSPFYILSAYSFYAKNGNLAAYSLILTLWIFLCFWDPFSWLVFKSSSLSRFVKTSSNPIGEVLKTKDERSMLLTINSKSVKLHLGSLVAVKYGEDKYRIATIINIDQMQDRIFCEAYILNISTPDTFFSADELGVVPISKSLNSSTNLVYSVDTNKVMYKSLNKLL